MSPPSDPPPQANEPDLWPRTGRDALLAAVSTPKTLADYLFALEGNIQFFVGANAAPHAILAPTTFLNQVTIPTGAVPGYVLTSDPYGNASWRPGGGVAGATFGWNLEWDAITPGAPSLYALRSDNDTSPQPGPPWTDIRAYFCVPAATTLRTVHVKGDAVNFSSVNTVAAPSVVAPSVVQSALASSGTASVGSQVVTLPNPVGGAHSIYLAIVHSASVGPISTPPTDSEGNTYTFAVWVESSSGSFITEFWYFDGTTANPSVTVTVTLPGATPVVVVALELQNTLLSGSYTTNVGQTAQGNSTSVSPYNSAQLFLMEVADFDDVGSYSATGGSALQQAQAGDGGVTQPFAFGVFTQVNPPGGTISSNWTGAAQTYGNYFAQAITVQGPPGPAIPVDLDLYLDGIYVDTLVTIPPGATTFDLFATPNIPIPAEAEVQLIVDLTGWGSGSIGNFIPTFGFG